MQTVIVDGRMQTVLQEAMPTQSYSGALEYPKGGFSGEVHLRCKENGKPATVLLTVGQANESVMFEGARSRIRPCRVVEDEAHTERRVRSNFGALRCATRN